MNEVYACECGHAPPHSHDPKVYEGVLSTDLEWHSNNLKRIKERDEEVLVPLACGHFHGRSLRIHDVSFEVCTTCARCYRAEVKDYDEQC